MKTNDWHKTKSKLPENLSGDYMMYYRVRQELSVSENSDVLLRGQRIVILHSLQKHVINLAHEGHQGLVRTKQLLREKVWFVNKDKLVAKMIESCLACQCTVPDIIVVLCIQCLHYLKVSGVK